MWVEHLDVRGFRGLRTDLVFERGLNFVFGENEAGKTSLFDALICALFGFSSLERRGGESVQNLSKPWQHEEYGLQATIKGVKDHESLRIEWDLQDHHVKVLDAVSGQDLSASVGRVTRDVDLGRWLLGIDSAEFRDVCCLSQTTIKPVKGSDSLKRALQESVASASAEVGHEGAAELLKEFARDEIGLDLRGWKPRAGHPLDRAIAKLDEAREALEAAEVERHAIAELARDLPDLKTREGEFEREERRVRQQLLLSRGQEASDRLAKAHRKQAESEDRPTEVRSLPQEEIDAIRRDRARLSELEERLETENTAVTANAQQVSATEARIGELTRERDPLEAYRDVDSSREQRVRALLGRRSQLTGHPDLPPEVEAASVEPDPLLQRYREERDSLKLRARVGTSRKRTLRLIAGVAAAVSIAAGLLISPIAWAGLLAAGALLGYAELSSDAGTVEEALRHYDASSLDELDRRLAEDETRLAEARAEARLKEERRQEEANALEALDRELREPLDFPAEEAVNLPERARTYLTAVERNARLTQLDSELKLAQSELREARAPSQRVKELEERRGSVARDLRASYGRLDIDADDLSHADQVLENLIRETDADRERARSAQAASQALAELLEEGTITELEHKAAELEASLHEHRARHGHLADQPGSPDGLQQRLDEATRQLSEIKTNRKTLEAAVERRDRAADNPAELKAEIEELDSRISKLWGAQGAIELALAELDEAASETYREFAPALRDALETYLPQITGGRYASAFIDEELGIKVRAPETGEVIHTDQLSRGTQDQIFLIERLEIARMLDRSSSAAPLLLDDPFDRFDLKRLRLALEIMAEVARERQVILFSEDNHVVEAVREVCSECNLIELPAPTARSVDPGASSSGVGA